jgi:hypothetical protein
LTKDVSTSFGELPALLLAALKLGKELLDFCQLFRNPSYSAGLLVSCPVKKVRPELCTQLARKLDPWTMLVEATRARRKTQLHENTSKVSLKTNKNVRLFTFR